MNKQKPDIASRDDIFFLLESFYTKAQIDEIIGDKFTNINMAEHTPIIADFWDSILFGANNYSGNPFGKHLDLGLAADDFTRWINLFNETIDEHFIGSVADEAKHRAATIATVFQHKLGLS